MDTNEVLNEAYQLGYFHAISGMPPYSPQMVMKAMESFKREDEDDS